jgi:hypothetical protein
MFDDDDFHTDEERLADEQEQRQLLELAHLDADLDRQQAALQQLADEDPLGFHMFADRPGWLEKRLSRNTPK